MFFLSLFLFFLKETKTKQTKKHKKENETHYKKIQKRKQRKQNETRSPLPPIPLSLCCVDSWPWDLPWIVAQIPSEASLEETDFPLVNSYQLQIVSWLGVGACVNFPFSLLGPGLARTWQVLGLLQSLSSYESCCLLRIII